MRQVKIGSKWTFTDYGLLLSPNSSVGEAKPKTYYIDIPFGDGFIDLTESLTGEVPYDKREIDFSLVLPADSTKWDGIRKELVNFHHGRKQEIIMPQYPNYRFIGRLNVGGIDEDKSVATIPISAICEPYMLKKDKTIVNKVVPSDGTLTMTLSNERMATVPTFAVNNTVQIVYNNKTYNHSAETFRNAGVVLLQGDNNITIKGAAGTTVKIEYQEGAL
ncbi:hypothetical protein [Vagococcus sp.]|uniref:hypothetical protein n=1 Tax=Vagococcus sp. TaxID=1933889 RepID=UPI003F9439B9